MFINSFRIQMYKCVRDSGWIEVTPLTVMVGKNEAGKTAILKALHKFNPYKPEPYDMDREWPRGYRKERNDSQIVCTAKFELTEQEIAELSEITNQKMELRTVDITKDYAGRLEVLFSTEIFPDSLHPNDIDEICNALPSLQEPVGESFKTQAVELAKEVCRYAHEGRFSELQELQSQQIASLQQLLSPSNPHQENENQYIAQYSQKLNEISQKLSSAPSIQKKAHEYVIKRLPTFIYMSDYRAFTGTAQLDQVKQRSDRVQSTEEDKSLLMIMELSGLNLDAEVQKGNLPDREQRQYDLDDASATLTREISNRWKQKRYEVQFRADGQLFYTFVKDERDPSLIRLEERSVGFQWFFSFDLMFMFESKGTFKDCVILLDEPGLHLHPDAQKDLLSRMEEYAKGNTLIYTTHLPFMIDLQRPERIRILSETDNGTVVTEDLTKSQPEAKFVLQAALGMSGSASYLVAKRNLVVEGVDDYWILSELSRALKCSNESCLPDDVLITPSGGASEAAYIATFMIGQNLDVIVLLDSDQAGKDARDKLIKNWIARYKENPATVLMLGDCTGMQNREVSIEDLFPDDFYLERVNEVYKKQITAAGIQQIEIGELVGDDKLWKRIERSLEKHEIKYNRGSVAKKIRSLLCKMKDTSELPSGTKDKAKSLFDNILKIFPEEADQ